MSQYKSLYGGGHSTLPPSSQLSHFTVGQFTAGGGVHTGGRGGPKITSGFTTALEVLQLLSVTVAGICSGGRPLSRPRTEADGPATCMKAVSAGGAGTSDGV